MVEIGDYLGELTAFFLSVWLNDSIKKHPFLSEDETMIVRMKINSKVASVKINIFVSTGICFKIINEPDV